MKLKIKRLTGTAKLPTKAHPSDAGFDLYADESKCLLPCDIREDKKAHKISTGVAVEIPNGYYGRVVPRSGLTTKTGLRVEEGTIDSGYRGEIKVMCDSHQFYYMDQGERIAQLIIQPLPAFEIEEVEELGVGERGQKGFGSSGK